jgi:hypothetical protein
MTALSTYREAPNPRVIRAGGRVRKILHGNPRVSSVSIWSENGARPRYNIAGTKVVYDYKGVDGFYDVRICDADGVTNVVELTSGRAGMPQRHNGNAKIHPGGAFVVFLGEAAAHYQDTIQSIGDPGIGLYADLYASDLAGTQLWNLTNFVHKMTAVDGVTIKQFVNPVFNPTGTKIVWCDIYGIDSNYAAWGRPQPSAWGVWRIRMADWVVTAGVPSLQNVIDLYGPPYGTNGGTYCTPMQFFNATNLVIAACHHGQHEYWMDQYDLVLSAGPPQAVTGVFRLTNDRFWNEDSAISPVTGRIMYMTNRWSRFELPLDYSSLSFTRVKDRELALMDSDGQNMERLTYFNDPLSDHFRGPYGRSLVAASAIKAGGQEILCSLGDDSSTTWWTYSPILKIAKITLGSAI